ncbi:MAG: ribonucleotide-diphosphate reductase subunit beta, partial [Acidovorax sp.]|nr:ribonucleotide-diphosphate reductase subunit beta [Acidovorax sp.]
MLTWDEEVKPSSQNQTDGGLQNNRQAEQSPLPSESTTSQPANSAHQAPAATHRRVNAADKRIIN